MGTTDDEPIGARYLRRVEKKGLKPRYAASLIAVLWLIAIVVFGIAEHLIDKDSFNTVWQGMWWATQTVTTVGYGALRSGCVAPPMRGSSRRSTR
jgi:voltage-gated potassium channel